MLQRKNSAAVYSVRTAIEAGYRLVDTASFYRNEREVGRGIKESGIRREDVCITTKLYPDQYSDADRAIDSALSRLGTDYIDIMMLHHPSSNDTEAYHAIEKAVEDGRVRSAALSCYYIRELSAFLSRVDIKPVIVQNEIHPYYQDTEAAEFIRSKGIAVQAWYPLGGRGYTEKLLHDPVISAIADRHDKTSAQIILRWDFQRNILAIPGSSSPDHIRENLDIFDFSLSNEEMQKIAQLNRNEKHDWY